MRWTFERWKCQNVLNLWHKSEGSKSYPNQEFFIPLGHPQSLNIESEFIFLFILNCELGIIIKRRAKTKIYGLIPTTKTQVKGVKWPFIQLQDMALKKSHQGYNFVVWNFFIQMHMKKVWTCEMVGLIS